MYKIGVIGDYDSICGYAALGLDIFPVDSEQDTAHTLKKLAANDYAIIYITAVSYTHLLRQQKLKLKIC